MYKSAPGDAFTTVHNEKIQTETTMVNWSDFQAALFDLDGVITPTAEVHERAWAALFEQWDYTAQDYLTHIDGKPRYDGVRSFLQSRDIELPEGEAGDDPGDNSVCALGNKKNEVFNAILDNEGVAAYPGSIVLLNLLDNLEIRQAIVSSSKNASRVLAAAGMADRFRHVVDGVVATDIGLAGKPAPDMFLRAADLLSVDPADAVVVEDATSGVAAGVAGKFGFVVGVDRGGNRQALLESGANIVVHDLDETIPEALK